MTTQTKKPHWILRTHDGVPVPPAWAYRYQLRYRDGYMSEAKRIVHLAGVSFAIRGKRHDVTAYRWLP